ncbi:MAG: hypothetical protein LLF97_01155 [Planctomycetaceae bacterium]|nr:hypothetical protein [Planctomycetaceae bacterium]
MPALPADEQQRLRCPRCGEDMRTESTVPIEQTTTYDGWELGEQLRHIERVLQPDDADHRQTAEAYQRELVRFDVGHEGPAAWHLPQPEIVKKRPSRLERTTDGRSVVLGVLAWIALSAGAMGVVCGGVLLGWSMVAGRPELWTIGLPAAMIGQVALLIGLVLQIDRLWRDNRAAVQKLDNVDLQLHDLQNTTNLLSATQSPSSRAFYSHFAGGAGPQLLLTDLKGQLDLLAEKIADSQR